MFCLDWLRLDWRLVVLLLISGLFIAACGESDPTGPPATTAAPTATAFVTATEVSEATQTSSSGSSGSLSLDEALNQVFEVYDELLAVLAGVSDVASAEAAVDEVTRLTKRFQELELLMEDYSPADLSAAALSGRLSGFGQELNEEMIRISSDPAVFLALAEALGGAN